MKARLKGRQGGEGWEGEKSSVMGNTAFYNACFFIKVLVYVTYEEVTV